MPLKERSGYLFREFININHELVNSHYSVNNYIHYDQTDSGQGLSILLVQNTVL